MISENFYLQYQLLGHIIRLDYPLTGKVSEKT